MKQLLEKTKLTLEMLARWEASTTHPRADALAGPSEQSSAETTDRPTKSEAFTSAIGQSLAQLLKRPEIAIENLVPILGDADPTFFQRHDSSANSLSSVIHLSSEIRNELKSVETEIKYAGYLQQQHRSIDRLKKAEQRAIPEWFDYGSVSGLSREMKEKLLKIRPRTLGHASRIPGVTPAAVSLVNVYIEIQARRREQAAAL
jgi:tRNA uridine 5-carboxymethylaminomethyl modification enzyme